MTTRHFCDLCDALIPEGDARFQVGGSQKSDEDRGVHAGSFLMGSEWVVKDFTYFMVDEKCYRRIRALVMELKGEFD